MNKIRQLPKKNAPAHAEIVELLEDYLQRAKDGEFEAIAIASVFIDEDGDKACRRNWHTGYDGHGFVLYSAVDLMKSAMADFIKGGGGDE